MPAMSSTAKMPMAMPNSVSAAIDLLGRRPFLDQELRFVHVRKHHAVADEPAAVADDDRNLAERLANASAVASVVAEDGGASHDFDAAASRAPG